MTDTSIRTAVAAWLSDSAAAETTYGHISTWETGGVTDMSYLFDGAGDFNEDISGWTVDSVTDMGGIFHDASSFDQDLGWCVDDVVDLHAWIGVFYGTLCELTSCGVLYTAALSCGGTPMGDRSIRAAVAAWLSDSAAAEAMYGHISTWETGGVTDMSELFCVRQDYMDDDWYNDCINAYASFNEDIGAWDVSGVTTMYMMFDGNSAFAQDLGWCVEDDVGLGLAFSSSGCASTSCGVGNMAALWCDGAMSDSNIRTAVAAWLADRTAAEATYGHISTWETSGVTDMSELFCNSRECSYSNNGAWSFNEDIGAWDTSGVMTMYRMFYYAPAFDQDLGWCVDDAVSLVDAFYGTKCASTCADGDHQCESTSCGVVQMDNCDTPVVNAAHRLAGSSALLALALPLITNISLRPPPRSRPSRSRGAARTGAPRPMRA